MKFKEIKKEELPIGADMIIDDEVFESATELQTVLKKFEDAQASSARTTMCKIEEVLEPYTQLGRILVVYIGQYLCSDDIRMKRKAKKIIEAILLLAGDEEIELNSTREFPLKYEPEQNVCYLGDYKNDEGIVCE